MTHRGDGGLWLGLELGLATQENSSQPLEESKEASEDKKKKRKRAGG